MRRFTELSFKHQLTAAIVLTSALVLMLAGVILVIYDWQSYRARLVSEATSIGRIAGTSSTAALIFEDEAGAKEVLTGLSGEPRVMGASLFSSDGVMITSFIRDDVRDRRIVTTPEPAGHRFVGTTLIVSHSIDLGGERIGLLQIAFDGSGARRRQANFIFAVLVGSLMSLLVATGISAMFQRQLSAPILSLSQVAQRVSAEKDYSVRVPEAPGPELGALTRAFNDMLGQIEERDAQLRATARHELDQKIEQLAAEIKERQEAQKALKESEDQLRQSQKMEAVGMLAGGVAHDFNNILTAIQGFGGLALARMEPDCRCEKYLREMLKAGDRAAALTRQLLVFSRKQVLAPKVLEINSLISNLGTMLRRMIGEDIDLVCRLEPEVGLVKADPGQLEQMILNLAVNGRDAMPQGGTLLIETRSVDLDEAWTAQRPGVQPGAHILLTVSDTGIGMTPEVQARIFEPFYTTKARGKGTGLGLATAYGIVKQSGGHVEVRSEPGRGTTFEIYLPYCDEDLQSAMREPKPAALAGGRETILLAEDEDEIRQVTAEILRARGYEVLDAPDGKTALVAAGDFPGRIHLLLTDVIMPGMNGRELRDRIIEARKDTRVLFMSGYTDGAITPGGILDPDIPFLPKPFSMEQLMEKVRATLDNAKLAA